MEHRYLLQPLVWTARGTYYNVEGHPFPLTGQSHLLRDGHRWQLKGEMSVAAPQPLHIRNDYSISPTEIPSTLQWTSCNPALGTLTGAFTFVGDCIVSVYRSPDGAYSGTETLWLQADGTYYNVGVSFCRDSRMSSWTAVLRAAQ